MKSRIQPLAASRWRCAGVACLLSLGLGAVGAPLALAADEPSPPIAADAVVPAAKVTLEARRLPLSQVLAAVKKQTGIDLTAAEGTFAREPKMTMAVSEMPLREWMESLASLYDVSWQAAGPNAFQLRPSGLSEDEKGVRHMGRWYNYWGWSYQDGRRPEYLPSYSPDWKGLVDNNLDLQAITTTGVPLNSAPAELQRAVRAAVEHSAAAELLHETRVLNSARGPLSISVARPPGLSGSILNPGKRNERNFLKPNPLGVDITSDDKDTIGRFDFRPPAHGRDLLDDHALFPPTAPAQIAAVPQDAK